MSADLQSLLDEVLPEQKLPQTWQQPDVLPRQVIAKVNYSHKAMIDLILANPGISQNDIAAHFGYTPGWVSQVFASDAFQTAFAERSAEVVDPTLRLTVKERFEGLLFRSMEILQKKLDRRNPDDIPDNLVLRTAEVAARAAGYGSKIQVNVDNSVNQTNHLEVLAENLTGLLRRKRSEAEVIDVGEQDDASTT